ncbi:hypothetical protein LCGC14_2197090 [marine sediment metagenome]|uniref:Uncharacterized protein n=1 Tax=marine sediment metagenome TaxID=412755 RepID=A0A0F9FVB5_9ZZZZ
MNPTTIGLDIAKRCFQVHGIDADGEVILVRALTRQRLLPFFSGLAPCLVGIEACATAHHWARELRALGHEVRLIPPAYVKPYVRRNKSDARDAAAICEAVGRPSMRFVPVKSAEQQASCSMTRVRDRLVSQRTGTVNALRAHLAEFGIVAAKGIGRARALSAIIEDPEDGRLPDVARSSLSVLAAAIVALDEQIAALDGQIRAWHRNSETSQRLASTPGIGPLTAATFTAAVPDPACFRSGREFAAWLGLTPRQHSTGGRTRLLGISKRGDKRLRRLLIVCASSVLQGLERRKEGFANAPWLARLKASKPPMVVIVALANKLARIIWALLAKGTTYQPSRGFLGA